jgi:colicin import membrane protein
MHNQMLLRVVRSATLGALAASLAACSLTLLPTNVTPVVPASTSVAQANAKLAQVAAARAAIEGAYGASERVCYTKFFVNNCLDAAKEKRRADLVLQAAIEDEAEYYKRKVAVDERDREVAQAIKDYEQDQARAAAMPAPPPRPEVKPLVAPKATLAARSARREAKAAARAAKELADAPRRAANVRQYEQRKLDAERRQRAIAEKKAAKAADGE